ncbi:MAG: hypothetical protein ACI87J_000591, partial [Colwellia sp.]
LSEVTINLATQRNARQCKVFVKATTKSVF